MLRSAARRLRRYCAAVPSTDTFRPLSTESGTVVEDVSTGPSVFEKGLDSAWKWHARSHVWSYLQRLHLVRCPRPVYHRIPNFCDAEVASVALSELPLFKEASAIAVGLDAAQAKLRALALTAEKSLYLPRPRLKDGFYTRVDRKDVPVSDDALENVRPSMFLSYGTPIPYGASFQVQLVVMGSVAVDGDNGVRVGIGDGVGDIEYALLRQSGAVDAETPVATLVHDAQLRGHVAFGSSAEHDVPVDVIVTPTRVIYPQPTQPKPSAIDWRLLSRADLTRLPLLQELKAKAETDGEIRLRSDTEWVPTPYYEFTQSRRR